jgi:hypothetical protein
MTKVTAANGSQTHVCMSSMAAYLRPHRDHAKCDANKVAAAAAAAAIAAAMMHNACGTEELRA